MPKKIKNDETGQEEELYTAEELEQIKADEIENYKKDHPDQTEMVDAIQKELDDAKEALEKANSKDQNFSNLRKTVDDLTKQLGEKVKEGIQEHNSNEAIKSMSDGDEELEKKIRLAFETTLKAVVPKTPEEAAKKVQDAYIIATGGQSGPKPGPRGFGPGGGAPPRFKQGDGKSDLKQEVKDLGKNRFGLTEEDINKYDKQDFSTTE